MISSSVALSQIVDFKIVHDLVHGVPFSCYCTSEFLICLQSLAQTQSPCSCFVLVMFAVEFVSPDFVLFIGA